VVVVVVVVVGSAWSGFSKGGLPWRALVGFKAA
jgi:hypothetical protein